MDSFSQNEIYEIKQELKSIINELYDISNGVRRDFSGIGNDICANRISGTAQHYEGVKKKLDKLDTSTVTAEFAAKQAASQPKQVEVVATQTKTNKNTGTNTNNTTSSSKSSSSSKKSSSKSSSKSNSSSKKNKNIIEEVWDWLF